MDLLLRIELKVLNNFLLNKVRKSYSINVDNFAACTPGTSLLYPMLIAIVRKRLFCGEPMKSGGNG